MTETVERGVLPSVRVGRGASYLVVQSITVNLLGAMYLVFATRNLSQTEFGVVSTLGMITTLFVTFATLEIPSATIKYLSEFLGKGRFDLAKGIFRKNVLFGFIISIIFSLLCLVSSYLISIFLFSSRGYQFLIILLALDVFAIVFSPFYNGVLSGLQKFKELSAANIVSSSVKFGVASFLLCYGYSVFGVVLGWIIGDFTGLILKYSFASMSFKSSIVNFPILSLIKYSLPLYASSILAYFMTYIDRFLILFFINLSSLGIYSIAVSASSITSLISSSITSALFPQLSELYGKDKEALKDAMIKASRYVSLICIPLTIGMATVSYPMITLFAGVAYAEGAVPLAIISLSVGLTCLNIVAVSVLMSLGATHVVLVSNILAFLAEIVILLTLLPFIGIIGAALGRMVLYLVSFGYVIYRVKSIYGLYIDNVAFGKALLSSIAMGLSVLLLGLLLHMDTYLLPLYILVGVIVYFCMLRFLHVITPQDVKLIKMFLPKSFNGVVNVFARFVDVKNVG